MSESAGVIIGRVSVKVWPDTREFRDKLKEKLRQKQFQNLKFELPVEADDKSLKRSVKNAIALINAESKARVKGMYVEIQAKIDGEWLEGEVRRLNDALSKATTLDIDTSKMEQSLNEVTKKVENVSDQVEAELSKRPRYLDLSINPQSYDSIRAGIARVNAELERLREKKIRVSINREDLETQKALLEKQLLNSKVKLGIVQDEQGFREVLGKVDEMLREKRKVEIEFGADEASLVATKERYEALLAEAERAKPVELRVSPDYDGWKAALGRLAEMKRELEAQKVSVHMDEASIDKASARFQALINDFDSKRKLEIEINDDRTGWEAARAKIDAILSERAMVTFEADLDDQSLEDARKHFDDLIKDYDNTTIKLEANVASLYAKAELMRVSRDRVVNLFVEVSKASVAKAEAVLAALSGWRMLDSTLQNFKSLFENLDKNVPLVGSLALAVQGLSAWILAAASNSFALAKSLAQIAGAGLALPGILGGMIVGVGTTIAVFKDFNAVLPDVGRRLGELQDQMSVNFWSGAEAPIRRMTDELLPSFAAEIGRTSSTLGLYFGTLADGLRRHLGASLPGMFRDLNESIGIAALATDNFAHIVEILGRNGSKYLPRLASWFAQVTNDFDKWLTKADEAGKLTEWIDEGIVQLKALGRVLSSTGSIFASLARAAEEAGGSSLTTLADKLEDVAKAAKSVGFQEGMVSTLRAAHIAMNEISTISGPAVKEFFSTFAETFTDAMVSVGPAIGELVAGIAEALSTDGFTSGFVAMFEGIRAAVDSLVPAFVPLGDALGMIGEIIGTLASSFGPLLASLLTQLSELLVKVGPEIMSAIEGASLALLGVISTLGPALSLLVEGIVMLASTLSSSPISVYGLVTALGALKLALGAQGVANGVATLAAAFGRFPDANKMADSLKRVALSAGLFGAAAVGIGMGVDALSNLGVAAPGVDEFATAFDRIANEKSVDSFAELDGLFRGAESGWSWLSGSVFGADLNNLASDVTGLGDAMGYVAQWGESSGWDKLVGANSSADGLFSHSAAFNQSKEAIEAFDEAMKTAVESGSADTLAAAELYLNDQIALGIVSRDEAMRQLPQYRAALEAQKVAVETTARVEEESRLKASRAWDAYATAVASVEGVTPGMVSSINEGSKAFIDFTAGLDKANFSLGTYMAELEKQAAAQAEWSNNMVTLSGKASQGLIDELSRLGPEGAPLVEALVNDSDGALARMEELFLMKSEGAVANSESKLGELSGRVQEAIATLPADVQEILQGLGILMGTESAAAVDGFVNGVDSSKVNVDGAMQRMADATTIPGYGVLLDPEGYAAGKSYTDGMWKAQPGLYTAIQGIADATTIPGYGVLLDPEGYAAGQSFANGMWKAQPSTTTATAGLIEGTTIAAPEQILNASGQAVAGGLATGMVFQVPTIKTATLDLVKATEISGPDRVLNDAGKQITAGMASGMDANAAKVTTSSKGLSQDARITSPSSLLYSDGGFVASGFASGITANAFKAEAAAAAMARKAKQSAEAELGIHSPSRVMREVGGFTATGFALGIEDETRQVEKAAERMADAFTGSLTSGLEGVDLAPSLDPNGLAGASSRVRSQVAASAADGGTTKTFNYHAAEGSSISSEEDLFAAVNRGRMVGF